MKKTFLGAAALITLSLTFAGCATTPAEPVKETYPGGTYDGKKTGCLVTGKEALRNSDGEGGNTTDYRIYTENCGTFGVQDDPFIGQWNSADTYGSISEGKTYDFKAYGWRNGFFSTFPNIREAYLVDAEVSE